MLFRPEANILFMDRFQCLAEQFRCQRRGKQRNHQDIGGDFPTRPLFREFFVLAKKRLKHIGAANILLPCRQLIDFMPYQFQRIPEKLFFAFGPWLVFLQHLLDCLRVTAAQAIVLDRGLGSLYHFLEVAPLSDILLIFAHPAQLLFPPLLALLHRAAQLLRQSRVFRSTQQQYVGCPGQMTFQIEIPRLLPPGGRLQETPGGLLQLLPSSLTGLHKIRPTGIRLQTVFEQDREPVSDVVGLNYFPVFPAKQADSCPDIAAVIRDDLHWRSRPLAYFKQVLIDCSCCAVGQYLHRQDMDIVMIETTTFAAKLGQGNAKDHQTLVLPQLDGQIKQIDPISVARQRPSQQEQANTQQPQANGLRARTKGNPQAI